MVDIDLAQPDKMYPGYLFWHQADELATDVVNFAMLVDAEGKLVHRWDSDLDGGGHSSYLLPSGGLLRTGIKDRSYVKGQPVAATDTLQITDQTGHPIWELKANDIDFNGNKITFHHDMLPMPNGNILALIYFSAMAIPPPTGGVAIRIVYSSNNTTPTGWTKVSPGLAIFWFSTTIRTSAAWAELALVERPLQWPSNS